MQKKNTIIKFDNFLLKLFPLIRTWGATGILIEWEDTFPYNKELTPIGSNGPNNLTSGYSVEDAKQILQLAGDSGLAVMPLIQTFGHMEVNLECFIEKKNKCFILFYLF